ncbi:HlyC/CorC family transporter [Carnobacteriaceae bacterium zg-ZUI252]|nr:HlyC/CorC family transporter [Carnobacteriaceae bacterium zg-ZUI252]MBS4770235.1 HlyC/CorC family transporter [Carnobacteriaceae bacterium zg-ZUI240]QTU83407.1 HlyC/CorC family transporter [Carnobacteriaceae bacterium zg-C25]
MNDGLPAQILLILVLTAINALFSATELAYVSLNVMKIKQMEADGNVKAKKVLLLLDNSDDFLATIQVIITFAGFLSSGSAALTFTSMIEPFLVRWLGGVGVTLSVAVVTLVLSYFTLVVGELYPKQVALQMPEKIALATANFVIITQTLFKPFVRLLSFSTGLLKKITPIEFTNEEQKLTRNEMKALLDNSRNDGAIDLDEFTMLQGVLSLDTKLAREVMVPRVDTFMIDIEDTSAEIWDELLDSSFSRIPIYEEDKDNIIGVLHVKSVLQHAKKYGFENVDFRELMNEALFVPSTLYIDDLLVTFKKEHQHMAILKDEYGGVEGIVTMEDLIEEIVGDIEDESDEESKIYQKLSNRAYNVEGIMTIEKFNDIFKTNLESEESDTIAGYILEKLGYLPEDDEQNIRVEEHGFFLQPKHVDNGRIRSLNVVFEEDYIIKP